MTWVDATLIDTPTKTGGLQVRLLARSSPIDGLSTRSATCVS